jgi:hypothetical protein
MPYILFDADNVQPTYFSCKPNDNVPNVIGNFVPEKNDALWFYRKEDAENFLKLYLRHLPHIEVKDMMVAL